MYLYLPIEYGICSQRSEFFSLWVDPKWKAKQTDNHKVLFPYVKIVMAEKWRCNYSLHEAEMPAVPAVVISRVVFYS